MLELAYKALDLLLGALFGARRIRVRVHVATLLPVNEVAAFVSVVNLSRSRDVEVTHVWIAGESSLPIINADRPLPVRLRPDETWETWILLRDVPESLRPTLFNRVRVRLSSGTLFRSKQSRKVPEFGHVAGGPVSLSVVPTTPPAAKLAEVDTASSIPVEDQQVSR